MNGMREPGSVHIGALRDALAAVTAWELKQYDAAAMILNDCHPETAIGLISVAVGLLRSPRQDSETTEEKLRDIGRRIVLLEAEDRRRRGL